MAEIWQGLVTALQLIVSLDPEVMDITARSLWISVTASLMSSLVCLPLASVISRHHFPGKRIAINLIQTLYSLPTVTVGLFVFVLFSRTGPFGGLDLMFTPAVMIIGQALLITPILLGLTISALSGVDKAVVDTAVSLGASEWQTALVTLKEARFSVLAAIIMGFSRAISEVGVAIMVGGNIKGFTRVITTAISLETSRGEIELSLALGIILLAIALIINIALSRIQQR